MKEVELEALRERIREESRGDAAWLLYLVELRTIQGDAFQPDFDSLPFGDQTTLLAAAARNKPLGRSRKVTISADNPFLEELHPLTREVLLRLCDGLPTRQLYIPKRWSLYEAERRKRILDFYRERKELAAGAEWGASGRKQSTGDSQAMQETLEHFALESERHLRGILVGEMKTEAQAARRFAAIALREARGMLRLLRGYATAARIEGDEEAAAEWEAEAEKTLQTLREIRHGLENRDDQDLGRALENERIREMRKLTGGNV